MSNVRRLTLSDKVGYLDTGSLPAVGGCNLLCLTDRQLHIINCFVFPYATWRTRVVTTVHGLLVEVDDLVFDDVQSELTDLDLQINGGATMSCDTIATAISDLAAAIAAQTGVSVSCGGGAAGLESALANLPDSDYLPVEAETPPEWGEPPEGFDTWDEYLIWKCQAAHAVWHLIDRFLLTMQGLGGVQLLATFLVPVVIGVVAGSFFTLGPVAIATLVGSLIAVGSISVAALSEVSQMRDYWAAQHDALVCQLYQSGDASDALFAVGTAIEDMIQSIVWSGGLAPFSAQLNGLLGAGLGAIQNNSLVNPLFKLVTGVALVQVECPCGAPDVTEWHFDAGVEYWTHHRFGDSAVSVVGEWNPGPTTPDPFDSSTGCIDCVIDATGVPVHGIAGGIWSYVYAPGHGPVAANGSAFKCDCRKLSSDFVQQMFIWYEDGSHGSLEINVNPWEQHQVNAGVPEVGKRVARFELKSWIKADKQAVSGCRFDRAFWEA